ncbi:MAG: hypothetical protein LKJ88_07370 [Bacilli bacterium]|jgi:hypothetical protein|nr:hypothetical protein [Bacilli bacterium]
MKELKKNTADIMAFFKNRKLKLSASLLSLVLALSSLAVFTSLVKQNKADYVSYSLEKANDDYLTLNVSEGRLTEEELKQASDKMGIAVKGLVPSVEGGMSLLDSCQESKGYLYSIFDPINNLVSIDKLTDLPASYSLMAGDFPKATQSIMLTDFQYALFSLGGYEDRTAENGTALTPEALKDPSALLGQKLYFRNSDALTISGILNTGFNLEHFQPYFDYWKEAFDEKEPKAQTTEVHALGQELFEKKSYSYLNLGFVSSDVYSKFQKAKDVFSFKDPNMSILASSLPVAFSNSSYGAKILDESNKNKATFFDSKAVIKDNDVVLPFKDYIYFLYRNNILPQSLQVTLPKDCLYSATSDQTLTVVPLNFFQSLSGYGIRYVTDKYYQEAFDNNEFPKDKYIASYYTSKGTQTPENIPESEKKDIFALYAADIYNSIDAGGSIQVKVYEEGHQISLKLLSYYLSSYKDTYFKNREFICSYNSGSSSLKTSLNLAGLTLDSEIMMTENEGKILCANIYDYYTAFILPKGQETAEVKKAVDFCLASGNRNIHLANQTYEKAISVSEKLNVVKYVFLALFVGLSLCSFFLISSLLLDSAALDNENQQQESDRKDLEHKLIVETGMLFLTSLVLFIPLTYGLWALIAKLFVSSSLSLPWPGVISILLSLVLSVLIVFCSYLKAKHVIKVSAE